MQRSGSVMAGRCAGGGEVSGSGALLAMMVGEQDPFQRRGADPWKLVADPATAAIDDQ